VRQSPGEDRFGGMLGGAASGGCLLAFFLVRQGLSRASLWSTVLRPLSLIVTAATVWVLVATIRHSPDGAPVNRPGVSGGSIS